MASNWKGLTQNSLKPKAQKIKVKIYVWFQTKIANRNSGITMNEMLFLPTLPFKECFKKTFDFKASLRNSKGFDQTGYSVNGKFSILGSQSNIAMANR